MLPVSGAVLRGKWRVLREWREVVVAISMQTTTTMTITTLITVCTN